jgi:hypothetical protein
MSLYDRRQEVSTVRENETSQSLSIAAAVAMQSDCFTHWAFYKQTKKNSRDHIWITSEGCKNRLWSSTNQAEKNGEIKNRKNCKDETMLHNYMIKLK